jgi:hypothetical protein
MLNILAYTLKSLSRRWPKQLALVLIYAIVVAFYASVVLFTSAMRREARLVLADLPELWIQQLKGGRLVPLSLNLTDSLSNIRGVKQVFPRLWGYVYDAPSGAVFTIMGADSLPQAMPLYGTVPRLAPDQALTGTGVLEMRKLEQGDFITFSETEGAIESFQIAGVFNANADLLTRDLVVLAPDAARRMLGLEPAQATDIAIRVFNEDETDNIGRKISERFPGLRVVSRRQLTATYEALFGWRGGIFIYGAMLSVLAFLILAWERAAGLNNEEKKELGILKAVGWQIDDVLMFKFFEGMVISLTATLLGIVLAWLHVFVWDAGVLKPLLAGWSVLYPKFHLEPVVEPGSVVVIILLAMVPYLTATLVPAWKGAITDPAEVMQG